MPTRPGRCWSSPRRTRRRPSPGSSRSIPGPTTDETYKGLTLTVYTPDSGPKVAATATGGVLLVGDEASVKAAVDRNGKDGLAASKAFTSAMAGISGDQVTRTYVDLKAYVDAMSKLADSARRRRRAGPRQDAARQAPAWLAFGGRIESDALVSDLVTPVVASAPKIDGHDSTIAGHLPASTVVLLELHQFDKLFTAQLDQLRSDPSTADSLKQVDDAAASLGGLDHLVGWIGDVGIVVTSDGTTPGGGLVIVPTDAAAADKVVTELRNLVALAGSSSGITTRDEAYGAGTITTIDFGDLTKLTGGGGAALGLPAHGSRRALVHRPGRRRHRRRRSGLGEVDRRRQGRCLARRPGPLQGRHPPGRGQERLEPVRRPDGHPQAGRARHQPAAGLELRHRDQALRPAVRRVRAQWLDRRRNQSRPLRPDRHQPIAARTRAPRKEGLPQMAVRIRLTRVGAKKQPTYRVVVADARNARDGRSIETIGHYNPRTEPIEFVVDSDKAKKWLAQGAQPSDTVARLFRNAGILPAAK